MNIKAHNEMASYRNNTNIVTFKTDLEGQMVVHKRHAAANTKGQHLLLFF